MLLNPILEMNFTINVLNQRVHFSKFAHSISQINTMVILLHFRCWVVAEYFNVLKHAFQALNVLTPSFFQNKEVI